MFIDFVSAALLLFVDGVYVGSPLFFDFRGLFTRLWLPFDDSVYGSSSLFVDFRGLFT
jgi:hypothetical protein